MNVYPPQKSEKSAGDAVHPEFDPPYDVLKPDHQSLPFVLASPHSGDHYPAEFLNASRLDILSLRGSEDSFVDELFETVPQIGAPLIRALFPRVYLDPNREPYELDPYMFKDSLPAYANTRSLRVAGGLGTVARVVTDGAEIYHQKMPFAEAENRIETLYLPYHRQVRKLIQETKSKFGFAILIDCHSMPSIGGPMDQDSGHGRADIVLGDRFGTSCAPSLTQAAEEVLINLGYSVARNNPYAGGYTTDHYGRPIRQVHALQIEINRGLYMDERTLTKQTRFAKIAADMHEFVRILASLNPVGLDKYRPRTKA